MDLLYFTLLLIQTAHWVQGKYHYPGSSTNGEDNIMLCCPRKNTIDLRVSICVPTPDGWNKGSEENCLQLQSQCPEFNEAECVWQSITCDNTSLLFPTCRLKYYAAHEWDSLHSGKRTWMEINYVNQHGTNVGDDYIIELHRYVNDQVADKFGSHPNQGDFPDSVPDKHQLGGIKWITSYQPLKKNRQNEAPICANQKDAFDICGSQLAGGWAEFINRINNEDTKNFFDSPKYNRTYNSEARCSREHYLDNKTNEFHIEDACKIQLKVTIPYVPITFNYITCRVRELPKDAPKINNDNFTFKEFQCYAWHDKNWDGNFEKVFYGLAPHSP